MRRQVSFLSSLYRLVSCVQIFVALTSRCLFHVHAKVGQQRFLLQIHAKENYDHEGILMLVKFFSHQGVHSGDRWTRLLSTTPQVGTTLRSLRSQLQCVACTLLNTLHACLRSLSLQSGPRLLLCSTRAQHWLPYVSFVRPFVYQ